MARTNVLFSAHVVESDRFLSLSLAAQALYVHLCFSADADGFISGARRVARAVEADAIALEELLNDGYILQLGSEMVVTHWWLNNKYDKANHHKARTKLCEHRGFTVEFAGEEYRSAYCLIDQERLLEAYQKPIIQSNIREYQGNESNSNPKEANPRAEGYTKVTPCPVCNRDCFMVEAGMYLYGECMEHGLFYIDKKTGEYVEGLA